MDAPFCDVVGCPDKARWISTIRPPHSFEECICEAHMTLLAQCDPDIAAIYREWTIFAAGRAANDRRQATSTAVVRRADRVPEIRRRRARPTRLPELPVLADLLR